MHSQDCFDGRQVVVSKEDVICMMPWTHLHVWPDGTVFSCCVSDVPIGKWPNDSLLEIWNSKAMRSLRRDMLDGKRNEICRRCHMLEKSGFPSLRNHSNAMYSHLRPNQETTNPDGSVDRMTMAYIDVRFSNICNLKCRTCGPVHSSSWHEDNLALRPNSQHPKVIDINRSGEFWKELERYLYDCEEIMFAGGESIITDEHYRILDHFIANSMTGVRLRYTTNFTVLNYKKRDLFSLWSRFSNVLVAASLDGSYERGEYIRKGTVWKDVVDNRKRMIEETPSTRFEITPTVSLMNVIHLPDFHREWIEEKLIGPDDIRLNVLSFPNEMSVKVLPKHLKDRARERIESHIEWLRSIKAKRLTIQQWQSVITFMDHSDDSNLLRKFHHYTNSLDRIRSESFYDVFPELEELYD